MVDTQGSDLHARIPALLSALEAADTQAVVALGEFHLRQDERGRVIGDFYKCRLSSVYQPVFGAAGRNVIGHEARVRCDGWGDEAVSPWGIFSMIAGDSALVRMDRLCRALHVLNYFGRAQSGWTLFLRIEPRLLSGVQHDHGKVFSETLRHCGIATARVVIEIPLEAMADGELLVRVVASYRARGYRIAANYPACGDGGLLDRIKPEFLKVHSRRLNVGETLDRIVTRVREWNGQVMASQIETARDLVVAARASVDLLQGFFVGRPDFEIVSRHGLAPVPQSIISRAIAGHAPAVGTYAQG